MVKLCNKNYARTALLPTFRFSSVHALFCVLNAAQFGPPGPLRDEMEEEQEGVLLCFYAVVTYNKLPCRLKVCLFSQPTVIYESGLEPVHSVS